MRMLHVILPRRMPSRSCLANVMSGAPAQPASAAERHALPGVISACTTTGVTMGGGKVCRDGPLATPGRVRNGGHLGPPFEHVGTVAHQGHRRGPHEAVPERG